MATEISPDGSDGPLVHEVPFPTAMRVVLVAIGLFVAWVSAHELWRGVWPLSLLTPFFGALLLAAWGGAFAALHIGLTAPQSKLTFSPGMLQVDETTPCRSRSLCFPATNIENISIQELDGSDGPTQFQVRLAIRSGENFCSRRFETRSTAEIHAASFAAVLGWKAAHQSS